MFIPNELGAAWLYVGIGQSTEASLWEARPSKDSPSTSSHQFPGASFSAWSRLHEPLPALCWDFDGCGLVRVSWLLRVLCAAAFMSSTHTMLSLLQKWTTAAFCSDP